MVQLGATIKVVGNVIVKVAGVANAPAYVIVTCPCSEFPVIVPKVLVPNPEPGAKLPAVCTVPVIEQEPNRFPLVVLPEPAANVLPQSSNMFAPAT